MPQIEAPAVVGLDTASDRWHAVCRGTNGKPLSVVDGEAFHSTPDHRKKGNEAYKSADVRRAELANAFGAYLLWLPPGTHIFCEEPLALKNGKTTRILSLAAGSLWDRAAVVSDNLIWHWVDVAHWKRVIVGNGNANKTKIQDHVVENDKLTKKLLALYGDQPDFFDAKCLLKYGLQALREGELPATL